jgi:hypothetical protein
MQTTPSSLHTTDLVTVDEDVARRFWSLYDVAFGPLRTASPCRQALTEEEFHEEMRDERIVKLLVWDGDEAVAMALLATDLAAIPWISPDYFEARFPEQYGRGAIYYLGAILTAPHRREVGNAQILGDAMVRYVAERDGVFAFDCASLNHPFMYQFGQHSCEGVIEYKPEELDTQHYYSITALSRPHTRTGRFSRGTQANGNGMPAAERQHRTS